MSCSSWLVNLRARRSFAGSGLTGTVDVVGFTHDGYLSKDGVYKAFSRALRDEGLIVCTTGGVDGQGLPAAMAGQA
jgi:hypothetical protein